LAQKAAACHVVSLGGEHVPSYFHQSKWSERSSFTWGVVNSSWLAWFVLS
jgi:hypothetical protein